MPIQIGGNKSTWLNRGLRGDLRSDAQRGAAEDVSAYRKKTEDQLSNPPQYEYDEYTYDEYEIPEEIFEYAGLMDDTADDLMETSEERLGLAREYSDYLQQSDMPGMDVYQEGIGQATAGAYDAIQQSGMRGPGGINQLYQSQLGATRDLAISNQQYKQNARQNAYQTMSMAFGDFANSIVTAGDMRGQGLQSTAQAKERQFQTNTALDQFAYSTNAAQSQYAFETNEMQPYMNEMDYNMANLGYAMQSRNAADSRRQQMISQLMNIAAQFGLSVSGGGGSPGGGGGAAAASPSGAGGAGAGGAGTAGTFMA